MSDPPQPRMRRRSPVLIGTGIVAVANLAAQPLRALRDLGDTDFVYAFMTAARMLHDGAPGLYVRGAERAARERFIHLLPTAVNDLYTNPPLAAWLIQPIALLPPETALAVFLLISVAAVAMAGWLLAERLLSGVGRRDRRVAVLLAVATLPGAQTLAIANWDGLLLLAIAGALLAAAGRRPVACGVLLAVLLVKPQTVWLVPVALLVAGHRRALLGFCAGAAVWVASTLALVGVTGMRDWYANNLPAHLNEAHQTIGIPGLFADALGGGRAGFAAAAALLPVAVAAAWRWRGALHRDLCGAVALALAASALAAPHIWPEDVLLLAGPMALLARWDVRAALGAACAFDVAYLLDSLLPVPVHAEGAAAAALVVLLGSALLRGVPWPLGAPAATPVRSRTAISSTSE